VTASVPEAAEAGGESTRTVLIALTANVLVGVAKAVAGLITGSAALLAEAAHSVADTGTELLLLTALRRSSRPADRWHPFGHGKERYFWSLLAAVSIFTAGAMFSIYQGLTTLFGDAEEHHDVRVAYVVLAVAFVLEGGSLAQTIRKVRYERAQEQRTLLTWLRLTDDPTVKTILFEDSAALVGLALASTGIALTQATGSPRWDGLAALAIGLLLVPAAYLLGRTNLRLLTGRQADPRLVYAVADRLRAQPEVEVLVDLLTMVLGTDSVLVCARLDFIDDLTSADLERACVRIAAELQEEFGDIDEVFLEPVPRNDPDLRARVIQRYGDILR
jgi:cation diffusion facilitator family transporter